jgi:biotin--protein ligase
LLGCSVESYCDAFKLGQDLEGVHKDANDDFQFHSFDRQHALELLASSRKNADPAGDTPNPHLKHILVCGDGVLPDRQITPLFDLGRLLRNAGYSRENSGLKSSEEGTWGIGEALLYGEVVTSTQTMFDK